MDTIHMTKELYDRFKEVQKTLQIEKTMSNIEIGCREDKVKFLRNSYFSYLAVSKMHYSLLFSKVEKLNFEIDHFPKKKNFFQYGLKEKKIEIPSRPELIDMFKEIYNSKNSQLINLVTFSFIPAMFQFFFNGNKQAKKIGLDAFHSFISQFKPNLDSYFTFSRSVFASPLFLRFVKTAFQPACQMYIENRIASVDFPETLLTHINHYKKMIPKFVDIVLGKNDKFVKNEKSVEFAKQTYLRSFLNFALSDIENAKLVGLLHYASYSKSYCSKFMGLCSILRNDTIVNLVVKIFLENNEERNELMIQTEDMTWIPSFFKPLILSNLDERIIRRNYQNNQENIQNTILDFNVYVCYYENDIIINDIDDVDDNIDNDDKVNDLELTMAHSESNPVSILRHLLQDIDTFPTLEILRKKKFSNYIDEETESQKQKIEKQFWKQKTIGNFFNDFIIKRGSVETYSFRKHCCCILGKLLEASKDNMEIYRILNDVEKKVSHTKEKKALEILYRIENETVKKILIPAASYALMSTKSITLFKFDKFSLKDSEIKKIINGNKPLFLRYPKSAKKALFSRLTLDMFQKPPIEKEIDASCQSSKIMIESAHKIGVKDQNLQKNILFDFDKLKTRSDIKFMMDDAFTELISVRKYELFRTATDLAKYVVLEGKGILSDSDIGPDIYLPILLMTIAYFNPKSLVYTYEFMEKINHFFSEVRDFDLQIVPNQFTAMYLEICAYKTLLNID
ncbi:hypothetical protein TRFO_05520 [Tritrichomonas foetus]|uniref:VPS9 domain-containing protein n=1 Tax=Tritrichomonas foetus TaxID=1144522 RepID=A0A1J4K576_9EUKA|nr:hypothetical protein TRFO_05520 [Tritrichomonas foetus]|eukprot:OHT06347.1 hypothetical protein TRFO_05520 [Tritrichomonas foetus]